MRPRLLDLFCGAGGAAMGYHRAGFDVTGVDIKPQKHYPFPFILGDALEYVQEYGKEYDAIHASPPCQAYCDLRKMWNSREHPDLVGPTREALSSTGKPYIIENVPGAPLRASVMLCGTMFGLGCDGAELWRHRYFETTFNLPLTQPCQHYQGGKVIGVYGGHGRDRRRVVGVYGSSGGSSTRDGTQQFSTAERREAMGIDWMTGAELSQAIPPAYTEWIGKQLLKVVESFPGRPRP
jgi:DNA (cytosine-5)-methyltransferase 1